MPAVVVVGAQWGDEGKGKVVDCLAQAADVVVRYAGGPNAGHTLVVGDQRVVVRLIPSGVLWPDKICVLGQGMVIDPALLVSEIDELQARGHRLEGRVFVSTRAHMILSHHVLADGLRESASDPSVAIGTTRRGIGPAYEDKAARRGLPLGLLRDLDRAYVQLGRALEAWKPFFDNRGTAMPSAEAMMEQLRPLAARIVPLLADTPALIARLAGAGKRVLLEGAQGTLLDIDHGTYPFVTSSSAVAGGACTGAGIGPRAISRVVGVTKAYATRVGGGPFPTELHDQAGDKLRQAGGEFGSVTGRPRRTGWLDLPALRYAATVNGLDSLIMTKLDVLTGIDPIRVCTAYETPQGTVTHLPIDLVGSDPIRPVYRDVPGWVNPIEAARSLQQLPSAARRYLELIESETGLPFDAISTGAAREALIELTDPFGV